MDYAAIATALHLADTATFRTIVNLIETSDIHELAAHYEKYSAEEQVIFSTYLEYSYSTVPSYLERTLD